MISNNILLDVITKDKYSTAKSIRIRDFGINTPKNKLFNLKLQKKVSVKYI